MQALGTMALAVTFACLPFPSTFAADPGGNVLEKRRCLVRMETWTEKRPTASGGMELLTVAAEVWTAAFQAELDEGGRLRIPAREEPYYLDGPLILKSGRRLVADRGAEIRLMPGANTCMVRNEHVVGFADGPVSGEIQPDVDILIEGGIWTTLATSASEANGNVFGRSSKVGPVPGTHGVILLQNVRRVTVRSLTVRQSKAFGVHLANVRDFMVEGITLDRHHRDGVHVNGPASDGVIRHIRGDSRDDTVALNAWDWRNYAPSFGPIERIVVEDVVGAPEGVPAANSIRILPGVKRFDDGRTLDCFIADILLRRITDVGEFKLYDQPNLELGREKDSSIGVGTLRNLRFEDLVFNRPGKIELHANADGIGIHRVAVNHPVGDGWRLLAIGPKSQTYKRGGSEDPKHWTEIFSPDLDCTVRNLEVSGIRLGEAKADLPIEDLVDLIKLKPNADFPNSTPGGGRGKGIWIR